MSPTILQLRRFGWVCWILLLSVILSFEEGDQVEMGFPVDAQGVQRLPYARALVAIARDHFTFLSAESGVPAPPGLGAGDAELNQRMGLLEDGMAALQAGMQEILQAKLGRKPKAAARPKDNEKQFPPGVDPAVAAHALQVGVSPDALAEMAQLFQAAPKAAAEVEAEEVANSSEEEEAFLDPALGVAGGSQDPMVTAVSQMSKILKSMYKEKKVRKDKTLDFLLDRVDVGLGKEHGSGGTKTKAAALQALSLTAMLDQGPQADLHCHREEDDGGLCELCPTSGRNISTNYGSRLGRTSEQNTELPFKHTCRVDSVRCLGRSYRRSRRRSSCSLCIGSGPIGPTSLRRWWLDFSCRNGIRSTTTVQCICGTSAPRDLGTAAYKAHRPSLGGLVHGSTSRCGRLSREKDQIEQLQPGWQERRAWIAGRPKTEVSAKRQERWRKGQADRGGGSASEFMKDQKCSAEDESWHHAMFPQVVNDRPALCTTKVPGSQTTPVNVLAIWSSLFRWVSLSRSSFATFLHSFLHNEPSEKPGTTYTLWPSAAP